MTSTWDRQKHGCGNHEKLPVSIEAAHVKIEPSPHGPAPPSYRCGSSLTAVCHSVELNVICYYNSIIGARTNRYGSAEPFLRIAGRSHFFLALHVPENRYAEGLQGKLGMISDRVFLRRKIFSTWFLCLHIHCGRPYLGIEGMPQAITNEILKQFSATAASGGIALFHMIVTPKAQTKEQVLLTAGNQKKWWWKSICRTHRCGEADYQSGM